MRSTWVEVMTSDSLQSLEHLLTRSSELAMTLGEFLTTVPRDRSSRIACSRTLCSVSFEHCQAVRVLIANGYFTSSLGVLRMQYDALVKATWVVFAAPDKAIGQLQLELDHDAAAQADRVPTLTEMLTALKGSTAPPQAVAMLSEFKDYSWKPLSSYVHGGLHAISRQGNGYPIGLLTQALQSSNGLLMMAGMMLIMLSGELAHRGKMPAIEKAFADCLPTAHVA